MLLIYSSRCNNPEIIKHELQNCFDMINIYEDCSDVDYVCHKCENQLVCKSLQILIEHLQEVHVKEINTPKGVQIFIKNNITIVESLEDFSNGDDNTIAVNSKPLLCNFSCPFCQNIFSTATSLLFHLNVHNEVDLTDIYVCNVCILKFADKKIFLNHLKQTHLERKDNESQLQCRTCGFATDSEENLREHVARSHCIESTSSTGDKANKKTNKNNAKYIPVDCPVCNKVFSNKYNMLKHMHSHNNDIILFNCDLCTKSYKTQGSLTYHKQVAHKGVLRFICNSCGEAFATRTGRDNHARLHSGDRPYTCRYCNKSYRAKNTLLRHIDTHLNVRKYKCHICEKKFRKHTHLKYHLTTHVKQKKI